MPGARPGRLPLLLGFLALLTLLGGPPGVRLSGLPASEGREATASAGIAAPLPGADAVRAARPEARDGAWGQRTRPPRTTYALLAPGIGAPVALLQRRRWWSVAGRPRLVATRRAAAVRAPPLLQPA